MIKLKRYDIYYDKRCSEHERCKCEPGEYYRVVDVAALFSCTGCPFQSDTGEFGQCDDCRRNPALKDNFGGE